MVGELGELVDVALDAVGVALELREDLVDVGGNFGHRAGEDVEIVVAIHLQLTELVEEATFARSGAGQHFLTLIVCRPGQADLLADAIVFVLFLEFVDFALQALLGEAEGVDHFF